MNGRVGLAGAGLLLAGAALLGAGSWVGGGGAWPGMMTGYGGLASGSAGAGTGNGMMGSFGRGMMGSYGAVGSTSPGPGEPGFVAGTVASPRVVRVLAGPGYAFYPSTIAVARGETVTFQVTSMGGLTHEFMVGAAADVAADKDGTPEVADIAMMQTKSITTTFDGTGPYAFACHASGHYEAGMRGSIMIVG